MGIDRVVNFPFPTPPSEEALKSAENLLVSLGAVDQPDASQLKNNKQKKLGECLLLYAVFQLIKVVRAVITVDPYISFSCKNDF